MILLALDWGLLGEKLTLVVIIVSVSLVIAMYETYAERKIAAFIQDRIGPNRAGPFGILQPLADGLKLFMKEEIIPNTSNKFLFILGPCLAMMTAMMTSAVIPWGSPFHVDIKWLHLDRVVNLQIADINIGILYIFGVVSLGVYGIMIGGWASNNKFSLIAALRGASQMISYELAMGISLIALLMLTGSLSMKTIVEQQMLRGVWNVVYQPLGFLIFVICAFAECNRTPFDLAEAENELVGGYHTEYSSMKLGFYLFAEYINMFISSAIISCLFFGGYHFPGIDHLGLSPNLAAIVSIMVLFAKIFFFIFFFMWVRWTVPRFRYDQLMRLGWRILIPLSILNVLATGAWLTFFK